MSWLDFDFKRVMNSKCVTLMVKSSLFSADASAAFGVVCGSVGTEASSLAAGGSLETASIFSKHH